MQMQLMRTVAFTTIALVACGGRQVQDDPSFATGAGEVPVDPAAQDEQARLDDDTSTAATCDAVKALVVERTKGRTLWFRAPHAKGHSFSRYPSGSEEPDMYEADEPLHKHAPPNLTKLTVTGVTVTPANYTTCSATQNITLRVTDGSSRWDVTAYETKLPAGSGITAEGLLMAPHTDEEIGHLYSCFYLENPMPAGVSTKDAALIRASQVRIGMTKPLALLALGEPFVTKKVTTATKRGEELHFGGGQKVLFVGGLVSEIRE